jgi:phage gpG-like protein
MPVKHSGKSPKSMIANLRRMETQIPQKVGVLAVSFFLDNFRLQGFQGSNGFEAWPERSSKQKGKSRALLVKTGAMRRAIQQQVIGNMVRVYVGDPANAYADAHNFGNHKVEYVRPHKRIATRTTTVRGSYEGVGSLKKKGKKMSIMGERHNVEGFSRKANTPQRKFIGNSSQLDSKINKLILTEFKKALS